MTARRRKTWTITLLLAVPGCFDPEATPGLDVDPTTGSPSTTEAPSGDPQEDDDSMPAHESSSTGEDPQTEDEGPATTTDGSSSSDDGGPVGPPPCGDGAGLCASAPVGWAGPVRPIETAAYAVPDCDGATPLVTAQGGLEAPPASCSCECGSASGASCTSATLSAWDDDTCSDDETFSQEVFPPSQDACNYMPFGAEGEIPLTGINYWSVTTQSQGGSCAPQGTRSVLPAAYQTSVHGCEVTELEMPCEDGAACYEAPEDGRLCVWRDGEHECPGDGFSVREVYYRGEPDDTRDCTACTCGTPEGSCPSTTVDMFIGYYCNAPAVGSIGACTGWCPGPSCETYALSAVLDLGPAVAQCDPAGGNPTGGVTERDPVTFCCSQ